MALEGVTQWEATVLITEAAIRSIQWAATIHNHSTMENKKMCIFNCNKFICDSFPNQKTRTWLQFIAFESNDPWRGIAHSLIVGYGRPLFVPLGFTGTNSRANKVPAKVGVTSIFVPGVSDFPGRFRNGFKIQLIFPSSCAIAPSNCSCAQLAKDFGFIDGDWVD